MREARTSDLNSTEVLLHFEADIVGDGRLCGFDHTYFRILKDIFELNKIIDLLIYLL
jgi:hypothetical protein